MVAEEVRGGRGRTGRGSGKIRHVPWQARFALLALIWGASFYFIKLALRGFEPLQISTGRLLLGMVFLGSVVALRRERLPQQPIIWFHLAVVGLLLNALPFSLLAWSETEIPSLLAGIYSAAAPLITVAVAAAILPDERPGVRRLAGLAVGLFGVFMVLGVWQGTGAASPRGQAAALAATFSYGIAYPYARRFLSGSGLPVTVLAFGQLLCAACELILLMPRTFKSIPPSALLGLVSLGLLGTGVAYIISYSLIRERGATTTSLVNYPIPVVSVILGVTLLGEPVSWNQPVGAALVLAGVALCEGRLRR
jgi:drug/metabolite transporter (DMT)-like permease